MTDLESMSTAELKELAKKATELAERKKDQEKRDLRAEIVEKIRAAGYTVDDIFPGAAPVRATSTGKEKAPAKYRNPENPCKPGLAGGVSRGGLSKRRRLVGIYRTSRSGNRLL